MKEYIKLDELSSVATLEELIADSKKEIKKWFDDCLEIEGGNKNAACIRLVRGVACGTLQSALDWAGKVQEEESRPVTLAEMADRICVSPCFLAMIGWSVGEKIMTDETDIKEDEDVQPD